jgi:AcrR family transcriptional regulator
MSATPHGAERATESRRDQLLAAARAVLSEHGYERTTVSSIAGRANVAQGTFYLYFPSKEALPGALAVEMCTAIGAATDAAVADAEHLEEAIEAVVRATFDVAHEFGDVLLICNRGIELNSEFEDWLRVTAPWRESLERFLDRFRATGEIEPSLDVFTTTLVLRDILDRAMKAKVLFGNVGYAEATVTLVQRALAR